MWSACPDWFFVSCNERAFKLFLLGPVCTVVQKKKPEFALAFTMLYFHANVFWVALPCVLSLSPVMQMTVIWYLGKLFHSISKRCARVTDLFLRPFVLSFPKPLMLNNARQTPAG